MQPDQSNPYEPCPREKIPPEILEWARQTFDEQEFLTQLREIEATGGVRLEDFIAQLEARATSKRATPRLDQRRLTWCTRDA